MDYLYRSIICFSFLAPLCWTQTCPSYEVGNLGGSDDPVQGPKIDTVYIDAQNPAPCSGKVYGWQLCTHSFHAPASVQFSMYRSGDESDSYTLVNGSVYELTLRNSFSTYTCLDRFLEEAEYFSVEEGDLVAACWGQGNNRVEIFSLRRGRRLMEGGSCSQSVINDPEQVVRRQISLSAYISE